MKFYIASMFLRNGRAEFVARMIRKAGHEVNSRWHDPQVHPTRNTLAGADSVETAAQDYAELVASDALVLLCEQGDMYGGTRGGRHFETGAAYALNMKVYTVWGPENCFHSLPGITNCPTLGRFIEQIKEA